MEEMSLLQKLIADWQVIIPVIIAILEVILRFAPTEKNLSIVHALIQILDKLVPNKVKGDKNKLFKVGKL